MQFQHRTRQLRSATLWALLATAVVAPNMVAATFQLTNNTHPQSGIPNFVVNDSDTVTITGAAPNSAVTPCPRRKMAW